MQVRARCRKDIENLKTRFGLKGKIVETPQADYRWRIVCRPSTWEMLAVKLAQDVNYGNFKASVGDDQHDKPLMSVWALMHRFQEDDTRKTRTSKMPLFEGGLDDYDDDRDPNDEFEIGGQKFHR